MGILFSSISNKDLSYKLDLVDNEVSLVDEMAIEYGKMSDEFTPIVMEFLQANLLAVKTDNPVSIAMESMSDTVSAMKEWFVKWLNQFRKFAREAIQKITDRYNSGSKLVNKYLKELPYFEPFHEEMYHYTIAPTELEVHEIQSLISTIRNGYIRIMRAGKTELNSVVASEMALISAPQTLDDIRGKIVHQPSISVEKYRDALKNSFRNNDPIKKKVEIDRSKLVVFCREYDALKALFPALKKNKEDMEKVTNEVITFLTKQPNAIREYHKQNSIYNPNYMKKYPNSGFSAARMDFEDLLKKKTTALSMYFASANTTLKNVQLQYDLFFAAKIGAINEAMSSYIKCIQKAYKVESR